MDMGFPKTPRLAVDAIVIRGDSILLVKRRWDPYAGHWALPGGAVEIGETLEAAVLRELQEETGLVGQEPELLTTASRPDRDGRGHVVSIVFRIDCPGGEPVGGDDAVEARFHPLAGLPPLAFDHNEILARTVLTSAPNGDDRAATGGEL